jgi:ribonuclease VapC
MIVVDASAVVAILNEEPDYRDIAMRLLASAERVMSPVSALEVVMALARKYKDPGPVTDAYLQRTDIKILPIDAKQAEWARSAFLLFGKGRHAARLNLGDCFSYAAAKALDARLLFVGRDFGLTDIRAA